MQDNLCHPYILSTTMQDNLCHPYILSTTMQENLCHPYICGSTYYNRDDTGCPALHLRFSCFTFYFNQIQLLTHQT